MSEYLISREAPVYMDIESCKTSYELRYVLAYEMAIRNNEVKNLIEKCIYKKSDCKKLKLEYGFTEYALWYYTIRNLDTKRSSSSENKGLGSINKNKLNKSKAYDLITEPLCSAKEALILNDKPFVNDESMIKKANVKHHKFFNKLSIGLRLKRPRLEPIIAKHFYVEMNFELPESELFEYIQLLQKKYEKYNTKGKIEMLTSLRLDKVKLTKANSRKFADMLYVYDYFKKCEKENLNFKSKSKQYDHISEALLTSFGKEPRKDLKRNTIENYIVNMKEYIEDLKCFELLTGISHNNK